MKNDYSEYHLLIAVSLEKKMSLEGVNYVEYLFYTILTFYYTARCYRMFLFPFSCKSRKIKCGRELVLEMLIGKVYSTVHAVFI